MRTQPDPANRHGDSAASAHDPGDAPPTAPTPTPALDPEAIGLLRSDLAAAGWYLDRVEALMGPAAAAALAREQRIPALVALRRSSDPAAALTRLFMLGDTLPAAQVAAALPALGIDGARALGLVRTCQEGTGALVAAFDLRPHAATLPDPDAPRDVSRRRDHHWWILSDLSEFTTGRPLHPDHVLGIGGATTSLLRLTLRTRVARALDLGCGCGIQALYMAAHADQVVATDLSGRACDITRFNAALNDVDLDVRQGSLFEPVAGEVFDLITSNPPFVITPQSVRRRGLLEYRDGGMDRDNLVAAVVRQAPGHLSPGGTVQMLANWEIPAASDPATQWSGRVEGWLEGLPVDAWVVQRDALDPTQYAEMWLRDSGGRLVAREDYEADYAAWVADFESAGVGAVGMGFLCARRLSGERATSGDEGGARVFDLVEGGTIPLGHEVEAALASVHLDTEVEELALVRAEDVAEERHHTPGQADPRVLILHQGGAMGQSIQVGTAVSAVVGASDGELTVGQIIRAVAVLTEQDLREVREQVLPVVRRLLRAGMLRLP
ncbi:methyltransferase [Schaalia sp. 19OD2882]|uniref:DUF7059 domain-containing protein n=1 Tax=Schaalia sp. 19OD2882 TaxID=2794089 RepID=UPI001C1EB9CC|nr:methyltransferase [Schaalia sp. 19OD2882]QWW19776.1 methyltransferase [Schaalia sp. 19OD2882]